MKVKKCWKAIWQNKLSEFSPLRRVSDSGLCAELTSSQNLKIGHVHQYQVIKLEILIADEHVQKIIDIIRENGRTGYQGDGMIIVSPVDNVYKVRTDEEGIMSV